MKGTKYTDIKDLASSELQSKIDDAYKELFNLRFQRAQGQLTDGNSITVVRHNIARLKTVLRQREIAAQMEKKA
jgi:large subunit ribosomal protein L29